MQDVWKRAPEITGKIAAAGLVISLPAVVKPPQYDISHVSVENHVAGITISQSPKKEEPVLLHSPLEQPLDFNGQTLAEGLAEGNYYIELTELGDFPKASWIANEDGVVKMFETPFVGDLGDH